MEKHSADIISANSSDENISILDIFRLFWLKRKFLTKVTMIFLIIPEKAQMTPQAWIALSTSVATLVLVIQNLTK